MITRPTGYFQEPSDTRDFTFGAPNHIADHLPKSASDLADAFDVLTPAQSAESCVGFAISSALVALRKFSATKADDPMTLKSWPSARFIWWASRYTHQAGTLNTGTFIRSAIKQVAALGVPEERYCPSFDGKDLELAGVRPSPTAFHFAFDAKKQIAYERIAGVGVERIAAWMEALSTSKPVVFGVPVDRAFMNWDGKGGALESPNPLDVIGGHAMCALAYDEEGVAGPCTYGLDWGMEGWFKLSWNYIAECAMDQWVISLKVGVA